MFSWLRRTPRLAAAPRRPGGWSQAEFRTLTAPGQLRIQITSVERATSWFPDLLDRRVRPEAKWEITGVLTRRDGVRIDVAISEADRLPRRLTEEFGAEHPRLARRSCGYLYLDARGMPGEPHTPAVQVLLRPSVYRAVLRSLTLPAANAQTRALKIELVGRERWTYEAFVPAIEAGDPLDRWQLPIKSAVTWATWRFATDP